MRAEGDAERAHRQLFSHNQRGDHVQLGAAVGGGHPGAQEAEFAQPADQLPGQGPVFLFDPVEVGDDFPFGEVARRLGDQPVLGGERLGRERVTRFRLPDEEAAAGDRSANPFGVHPITSNCVYLVYLVFLV